MNYYNYFTEIEETFVRRRGKNLVLSPLDWALIEIWRERRVPLHVVVRAIESVFDIWDNKPNQRRTVKSLAYCREEIEAQFEEWLDSRVGADDEEATEDAGGEDLTASAIAAHLQDSRVAIEAIAAASPDEGLRETLGRVCVRLNELAGEREDSEKLERSLDILDDMIDRHLLETDSATAARAEITELLKPNRKSMEKEAYDRTFALMLRKRLRDQAGIPRLSLFYL